MRANTKKKHNMGRRFAILICVAATGVMALGAQTGAETTDVVEYDSKVTIGWRASFFSAYNGFIPELWIGQVRARPYAGQGRKCMYRREVILFRKRPGPDRKLGATRSFQDLEGDVFELEGQWYMRAPERGRVYAKVAREVGDGFVCRADYSHVILNGGSSTRR